MNRRTKQELDNIKTSFLQKWKHFDWTQSSK